MIHRRWLLLGALALLAHGARGEALEDGAVRRRGTEALEQLVAIAHSDDAGGRLRARRLIRLILHDYYRARCPRSMRFVPGATSITPQGVTMEGGFYLSRYEVTLDQFRAFARETGLRAERWAVGDGRLPVTMVSFEEASACATWYGARLPTRDELRFAATVGRQLRYPWGDRFDPRYLNSLEGGRGTPEPVGSHEEGSSVHGVADLRGNVAEWTSTRSGDGARARYEVVGGSYRSVARAARFVTYRLRADQRQADVGFRMAKSLPPLPDHRPQGS